jgi:hypothetical protein
VNIGCIAAEAGRPFLDLTERLSAASVDRRWEAYRDIAWDAEENAIEHEDPRWGLSALWDPLGASEWYRDQSIERRSAVGLLRQAMLMKASIEFEAVLMAGLVRLAARLPNTSPMFRYAYHEVSEEAQHSMMFQEFINRSGFDPPPSENVSPLFEKIAGLADKDPALFFVAALAGEEAFDYIQRRQLADAALHHPLAVRIAKIHIAEEARHVAFARAFLRDVVPRLPGREVRVLRYQVPYLIGWIVDHLFNSGRVLVPLDEVPGAVGSQILAGSAAGAVRRGSVVKLVGLCSELMLVDARVDSIWAKFDSTSSHGGARHAAGR